MNRRLKFSVMVALLLPLVLGALETVNLIKDHSFEKDSDVWQYYALGESDLDSAVANRHDSKKSL